MAVFSASRGREARKSAYFGAAALRGGGQVVRVLGVHDQQAAEAGDLGQGRAASCSWSSSGNSSTPDGRQEALEAEDAGVVQRTQVLDVVRDRAAPEADVDVGLAAGDLLLGTRRLSTVVVGGRELSGMSTRVVMPPAAAARVAVQKPSHSVRPGSLTWTWVSTRPGSRTSSPTSSRRAPAGTSASYGSTAAILPSATATDAARVPSGVTTRVERSTSSRRTPGPLSPYRCSRPRHRIYFHVHEIQRSVEGVFTPGTGPPSRAHPASVGTPDRSPDLLDVSTKWN